MPAFERNNAEAQVAVDTLLPPVDPSRPRLTYAAKTGLAPPVAKNGADSLLGSGFFGNTSPLHTQPEHSAASESSPWDAPGFSVDPAMKNSQSNESKSTGSSWKFW